MDFKSLAGLLGLGLGNVRENGCQSSYQPELVAAPTKSWQLYKEPAAGVQSRLTSMWTEPSVLPHEFGLSRIELARIFRDYSLQYPSCIFSCGNKCITVRQTAVFPVNRRERSVEPVCILAPMRSRKANHSCGLFLHQQ